MTIADTVEHQALYRQIPSFTCKKGCTDCCGIVPATGWEVERMGPPPNPGVGAKCAYATPDGCSVYDRRPLLCRMFGAVDDPLMTCPHGCRPLVTLTPAQGDKIMGTYNGLMKR